MNKQYHPSYIETHDIDWFCKIGNQLIHCASNGGNLPEKVNNRNQNRKIQEIVANLDDIIETWDEIAVNDEYVYARLGQNESPEAYNNYIASFVAMAKKGFISFDRMINRPGTDVYMWIAKPKRQMEVEIENLPVYDSSACRRFSRRGDIIHVDCLDQSEMEIEK